MRDDALDRIRAFAAEAVSAGRRPAGAGRLVAVGWATVETDRAVGELAAALGIAETSFRAALPSVVLGASCLVVEGPFHRDAGDMGDLGDIGLAIIEPATEGRIAAGLARWDEGPLVAWYAVAAPEPGHGPDFDGSPGPFGPERPAGKDPLTGPHRLLVGDEPGTIRE